VHRKHGTSGPSEPVPSACKARFQGMSSWSYKSARLTVSRAARMLTLLLSDRWAGGYGKTRQHRSTHRFASSRCHENAAAPGPGCYAAQRPPSPTRGAATPRRGRSRTIARSAIDPAPRRTHALRRAHGADGLPSAFVSRKPRLSSPRCRCSRTSKSRGRLTLLNSAKRGSLLRLIRSCREFRDS